MSLARQHLSGQRAGVVWQQLRPELRQGGGVARRRRVRPPTRRSLPEWSMDRPEVVIFSVSR
jgi:hypothetical protein